MEKINGVNIRANGVCGILFHYSSAGLCAQSKMSQVSKVYEECLHDLDNGNSTAAIRRVERLTYDGKLSLLMMKRRGEDTVLTRLFELHHKGANGSSNADSGSQSNPVCQILKQINHLHLMSLLTVGDCDNKTLLHLACYYDDLETVMCIMELLADEAQKFEILSAQDNLRDTSLQSAAISSSKNIVEYLLDSLPPTQFLQLMAIRDRFDHTPFHRSLSNQKGPEVAFMFLSFLDKSTKDHQKGKVFIIINYYLENDWLKTSWQG